MSKTKTYGVSVPRSAPTAAQNAVTTEMPHTLAIDWNRLFLEV